MQAKEIFLNTKWGKIENNNHHQREKFRESSELMMMKMMREERLNERERESAKAMDGLLKASVV